MLQPHSKPKKCTKMFNLVAEVLVWALLGLGFPIGVMLYLSFCALELFIHVKNKRKRKRILNAINEWGSTYSLAFVQSHSTLC